ncbi:glycine cleavage system aminomethyltransferase GcvT [uncultured Castellaniella sp.]|uniref:glycine cleavage system aminomethyltransferase GcvT n=1 Tax=uncultured Castellaniella sp. TaxID=647907 RepID=UPI00262F5E1F|nr:glycine cleavage system aminomethyltransferase GcvT [uncultured Castellaniella sp.]
MSAQTPLFDTHVALGAKIVDFGGWDMPLAYGSQLEEHHAVRQAVGMFDVSHMLNVDVAGASAPDFLRHLLANDVAKIAGVPGKALYSCMLRPEGGVIDDLIVYFFASDRWRIVVNAGTADKDVAWMREQAEPFGVTITPRRDLAMVAVQGPKAREIVWAVHPEWQAATQELKPFNGTMVDENTLVARTGYTGEDGFEIVLPATAVKAFWDALAAAGVHPCGLGARDTLRLEAGMNLYGQDMDETVHPLESGLAWTVSFKDETRDFIGRDVLESAAKVRELVGLKLLERGIMRSHMKVRTARGEGEVTSGTMAPTLGFSIGLARVPVGSAPGDRAEVEIRGKWLPAEIVRPPFVRNGKALV